jgi:hypothetical protein
MQSMAIFVLDIAFFVRPCVMIRHIFPDCAGLQMQSFRIHATHCSAILPFLTLVLSTHDPVHFHDHNPCYFHHDILIPAVHAPLHDD